MMDPDATLYLLLQAIEDRDLEAFEDASVALHGWLKSGGYLPTQAHTYQPPKEEELS